jgi:hypothetical protein
MCLVPDGSQTIITGQHFGYLELLSVESGILSSVQYACNSIYQIS